MHVACFLWCHVRPVIIRCCDMTRKLFGELGIQGLWLLPFYQCVLSVKWVTVCFDMSLVKGPWHIDMSHFSLDLMEWQPCYFCAWVCKEDGSDVDWVMVARSIVTDTMTAPKETTYCGWPYLLLVSPKNRLQRSRTSG